MGNIDTERFYQVTVQMLSRMIENIVSLSGKQDCIHEKEHIFIFLTGTKDGAAAHNSL